ncbi:MAG: Ig-like domain-containing protein [Candidatus Thermoplasmatota archaeon]|nr:Ig-like domain-containing protein [Candidatus Thermoplasmatota archaeon]
MRTRTIPALMVTFIMVLSALLMVGPVDMEGNVDALNVWAPMERDFYGFIGNLTPANSVGVNLSETIFMTALDTNTTPPETLPRVGGPGSQPLPPWTAYSNDTEYDDWNMTTMEFHVSVDIEYANHPSGFDFQLGDRYGWNESGGGLMTYPMPYNFSKSPFTPYYIPNGTLYYIPGTFGNLSLTIYNGSSDLPLEGVNFSFMKHSPFNSVESGIQTNASGDALFEGLQMGIDNTRNNISINVIKPHFNTEDGTGQIHCVIREGKTPHYPFTLVEDDLVKSSAPADLSTGVESNKTKTNLFVLFHEKMLQGSVDQTNLWIEEDGGSKISCDYDWNPSGDLVKIVPEVDLDFNTTYNIKVTPRVKNITGDEILWRTFSSTFTTHLEPARVFGRVYINNTMTPAPSGTFFKLDNGVDMMLDSGNFDLIVDEDENHRITVYGPTVGDSIPIDEYMYYGQTSDAFTIPRGGSLEIASLVLNKQPVRTVLFNVMDEDGNPLEGANLINLVTYDVFTTDRNGSVVAEDLRKDISTSFKAEYENYDDVSFSLLSADEDHTVRNVTMIEDPLPISIKARGREVDIELTEAVTDVVDVESRFILDLPHNMDADTMNIDNIRILGPGEVPVVLDIQNETDSYKRWFIDPRSDLEYNKEYTLIIGDEIAEEGGSNPLWRDVVITFSTEGLDPAAVNGRIMVGQKPVEDIKVTVLWGGKEKSTLTNANGYYLLDLPMSQKVVTGVSIIVNGSKYGLETVELSGQTLKDGLALTNDTDFTLERLPDWVTVLYPKDELGRMLVDGAITIRFSKELEHSDLASFMENFTLRSTTSVEMSVNISDDNRVITLTPSDLLDHDTDYLLKISSFEDGEFNRELKTTTGIYALIRGETLEISTEFKPIEVILQTPSQDDLDKVSIEDELTLYFTNYRINRTALEAAFQFKVAETGEDVRNVTFDWKTSGRSVDIYHDTLDLITEYMILIPAGAYGENGETMRADYLLYFTTLNKIRPEVIVDKNFPATAAPGPLTITVSNPLASAIRVAVLVKNAENGDDTYEEIANITMTGLEERQLDLDLSGYETGDLTVLLRITDPSGGSLINEYTRSLVLSEDLSEENGPSILLWVVVGIFVLVILFLGIFLYTQTKKKDIEEELREEFECPECHHLVSSDDTVCPHCGAEFEEEAYKCPKCGNILDPDDDECSECGYDFSDQEKMELEDEDEDLSDEFEEEDEMELEDEDEDLSDEIEEEDEMEEMEEEEDD